MGESEFYLVYVNFQMPVSPSTPPLLIQQITVEHLLTMSSPSVGAGQKAAHTAEPLASQASLPPATLPNTCQQQKTCPETHENGTSNWTFLSFMQAPGESSLYLLAPVPEKLLTRV